MTKVKKGFEFVLVVATQINYNCVNTNCKIIRRPPADVYIKRGKTQPDKLMLNV